MSQQERQPLLPRPPVVKTRHSLPDRVLRQGNPFSVSPGGQSWHKRLSEGAGGSTSPPARSPVPTYQRQRTTSRVDESAEEGDSSDGRTRLLSDRSRRPYHYNSQVDVQGQPMAGTVEADPVEEAHYRRYQYYTRLQNQTGVNLDVLNIPEHAIPASFFQIQFLGLQASAGKQSSIVTIFAIWNTMMGTSLLSMPWALEQAGLVMGLLMMVLISGMCLYTAYRIIQVYTIHSRTMKISEFGDLCGILLGRWAEITATAFSVLAILGAAIVYWVLMSNFLFSTVVFVHDSVNGGHIGNGSADEGVYCPSNQTLGELYIYNHTLLPTSAPPAPNETNSSSFDLIWGQFSTVPLFLVLIVFPLINLKSATFFTKFNSLGTVSILFILSSVLYRCYEWGINADFSDETSEQYIPLARSSFPSLTGILALGLFIHNAIITIMTNNKHQENNGRDMSLAYILVTATYMLIGASFYIAFPLPKSCIEDNLLDNFHKHDVLTVAAKIFLFFQMLTVFPLIMYILRVSVLYPIYRSVWPGVWHILGINATTIVICVLFAIFLPHIGMVIRFSGAACGMTIIFALPVMVYMASVKRSGELSWKSIMLHSAIIMLGASNFIAQFFI